MQYKFSNIGTEPITYAEAKAYMRLNSDTDQTYIELLIKMVRSMTENITQRALIIKTIEVFYDIWDTNIALPFPEHDEITECTLNGDDILTEINETGLTQKIITVPASIANYATDDAGLKIKYTTTGAMPDELKQAMFKEISDQYYNRGSFVDYNGYKMTNGYASICLMHKVI